MRWKMFPENLIARMISHLGISSASTKNTVKTQTCLSHGDVFNAVYTDIICKDKFCFCLLLLIERLLAPLLSAQSSQGT